MGHMVLLVVLAIKMFVETVSINSYNLCFNFKPVDSINQQHN